MCGQVGKEVVEKWIRPQIMNNIILGLIIPASTFVLQMQMCLAKGWWGGGRGGGEEGGGSVSPSL